MTYRKRVYTELLGMLALQVPALPPVGAGCSSNRHTSGCSSTVPVLWLSRVHPPRFKLPLTLPARAWLPLWSQHRMQKFSSWALGGLAEASISKIFVAYICSTLGMEDGQWGAQH